MLTLEEVQLNLINLLSKEIGRAMSQGNLEAANYIKTILNIIKDDNRRV